MPAGLPANSSGFARAMDAITPGRTRLTGDRQALALMPLTRRFLSGLAPGLGDFYFVQRELAGARPTSTKRARTTRPARAHQNRRGRSGAVSVVARRWRRCSGQVPPPVNRFDVDVQWGSLIRAVDWEHPDEHRARSLAGPHAAVFAFSARFLSQGGDELGSDGILCRGGGVSDCCHGRAGDRHLDVAQYYRRGAFALRGNPAGDARRFFAFDPGEGAAISWPS